MDIVAAYQLVGSYRGAAAICGTTHKTVRRIVAVQQHDRPPRRARGRRAGATVPPLPADLEAGLRRLKLAKMRALAPELLLTAKTQRWKPEELLRTLVEAEIAAREESNTRNRLRAADFPVVKTVDDFGFPPGSWRTRLCRLRLESGGLVVDR